MMAKDSDKLQWSDPKDYGLPFVEITPIRSKAAESVVEEAPSRSKKKSEPSLEASHAPVEVPVPQPVQSEIKEEPKPESRVQIPPVIAAAPKKESTSWVWVVVLIVIGIVSVLIWQIQSQSNSPGSDPVAQESETIPVESAPSPAEKAPESTPTEQNQEAVNQDSITSINNSNPNISNPAQTGTTIANTAVGNLIRIESKAERPQYFIIVGSLPNEKLATAEASVYFGRSSTIYLITPYEGGSNYRLAIGKFGSFKSASEELERIKSNYSEELWILKY